MTKTTTHCITLHGEDIYIEVLWIGQQETEHYEVGESMISRNETFWEPLSISDDEGKHYFDWHDPSDTDFGLACVEAFENDEIYP